MTYKEVYDEFANQCKCDVVDYRPCCELFDVPSIPNAIVIWLRDGNKIIYIHNE